MEIKSIICKILGVLPNEESSSWAWEIDQYKAKLIYKFPRIHKIYYRIASKVRPVKKDIEEWFQYGFPYWKTKVLHPGKAFLVLTPEHKNIGDHAIAVAEQEFLSSLNISFVEVTEKELKMLQEKQLLNVLNGSRILVCGGGNLGTLWFTVEKMFRDIIQENPKSQIVLFPNTMYYEQSEWGQEELEKSVKIYNTHPNLILFAREEQSYQMMKAVYRNVYLSPDIALILKYGQKEESRKGCALCFRDDHERTMTEGERTYLQTILKNRFGEDLSITDMKAAYDIPADQRKRIVEEKFCEFAKKQLVLTDRLHCMIFCAVSATPCIVLESKSHKVRGSYTWIQHLPYIRFVKSLEEVDDSIEELLELRNCCYTRNAMIQNYEDLKKVLMEKRGKNKHG